MTTRTRTAFLIAAGLAVAAIAFTIGLAAGKHSPVPTTPPVMDSNSALAACRTYGLNRVPGNPNVTVTDEVVSSDQLSDTYQIHVRLAVDQFVDLWTCNVRAGGTRWDLLSTN